MAHAHPHLGLARHNPWPLIVKCARERCRPGTVLAWGLVTLTITTAICLGMYLGETERGQVIPQNAAQAIVIPVIIIQSVILMFLGTGAVAYGVASERHSGVMDYQRMTPMSTPAKLIGYLIGLPAREYLLFALTLPFMAFGVIRGGLSYTVVAHFYLIFAMSIVVYHLTGMVAGMISPKARWTAYIAPVMVVILYFGLPNLSRFGLTFFEFLTIRPALFGLVQGEIERLRGEPLFVLPPSLTALDNFRAIPFFGTTLHPTVYTMLVQTGLVATLWHITMRRWRSEDIPGFSKIGGTAFLLGTTTLVLGSAWASLSGRKGILAVVEQFDNSPDSSVTARAGLLLTLLYSLMIVAIGVFTLANTSPSPFLTSKGYQRVRKHGGRTLGFLSDASTSLPIGILAALISAGSACAMFGLLRHQRVVLDWPLLANGLLILGVLASLVIFAQAVCERFTPRGRFVVFFVTWVIPMLAVGVLAAADSKPQIAAYIALPFPPAAAGFAADQALSTVALSDHLEPLNWFRSSSELAPHFPRLAILALVVHAALAVGAQTLNIRDRARRRRAAGTPPASREPLAVGPGLAFGVPAEPA